ncbi:response regulator receiver protein [Nocardioides sp. Root1257]|uniref:response regulator n=1 Tax=unclassified Nocardioides TaxID=2615069 RepID=UPI0006F397D5|nr:MULTISPECIES: response regulator [unclassified Nocardioides]KQW49281.1 response regulator receiver protein [Nocardioides sp. Root1257]KRC48455.1 response regulator receiver protein [Nocardioides sp. Root224]
MPIRVLLVDDVVEVRRLVRTSLRFRGGFEVVGEAADGAEAVRLVAQLRPDVVVLDLGLPDIAGQEVLARIRGEAPMTKVVVFSGLETVDRAWIDANAAGFVLKDADLGYLVELLESVGRATDAEAVLDLPNDLSSVSVARRFVRDKLSEWGIEEPLDDAQLVVSELAANALTHADSSYRVRITTSGSALRIEVEDGGVGTPEPQPLTDDEEHGRGLHLVGALAASWGMDAGETGGKRVWAELPITAE